MFKPILINQEGAKQNLSDDIHLLIILLLEKIRLGISCESSARQTIHMKCQVLFSLKMSSYFL